MSEASVEELSEIVPKDVASKLKKFLENLNNIV